VKKYPKSLRKPTPEERQTILGGIPVNPADRLPGAPPFEPQAGFVQRPCAWCGMPLWVGTRVAKLEAPGVPVVCPRCIAAHVHAGDSVEFLNLDEVVGPYTPEPGGGEA
jgi:hypothetical protein